tara:strand:- start:438 stop:563 length:126 start_codon:yes stop_codon:yes gene_type:complete
MVIVKVVFWPTAIVSGVRVTDTDGLCPQPDGLRLKNAKNNN